MQYEIYVDKLFVMNMFFNCMILFTTKRILKLNGKIVYMLLGGMTGSLGFCSVFLLPFTRADSRMLYLLCIIYPAMIGMAFYGNPLKKHIQAGIAVFGIALMSGKLIESVYLKVYGSKYMGIIVIGFASVWLIYGFGKIYSGLCEEGKKYYTVRIKYHANEVEVVALYDTGNLLRDPVTGKYVHIVDKTAIRKLMESEKEIPATECGLRLIPYHTIAKSGLIPVLHITEMCVNSEGWEQIIKAPLIGISSERISSDGRYHMILNSGELK